MLKRKMAFAIVILAGLVVAGCDDDNESTLAALAMPGEMHLVERCTLNGKIVNQSEAECKAAGGSFERMVFVANTGTGTVSYLPYYPGDEEFDAVDITTSVPGVTSIPTGEWPDSIAGDDLGAFVILTSAVHNDLSIISVNDKREIAFQELDKVPRKVVYDSLNEIFYVFFDNGVVQSLDISFDCGAGQNELTSTCALTKDKISVTWKSVTTLDGNVRDYVADPTRDVGYVTYVDRRYVSVLGLSETSGTCLDGSSAYPCEIERLGAGFGCSDGIDNDGNGLIDEKDPSCFYPWSAEGMDASVEQTGWMGIGECNDGIDNNGNGLWDALDPGCTASNDASEDEGFQPMVLGTCADGIDNDGDGDIDRDDVKCRWPTGNESEDNAEPSVSVGLCRDGLDNDGDGNIDGEDLACYGKNGFSETEMVSYGRGNVGIDPDGRWLYVLDPVDSQLIVIDLETKKTLDRSGWYPRHRVVGIPVPRLALDVVGDFHNDLIYEKNGIEVYTQNAVAYVSSSSGSVTEYEINHRMVLFEDGVIKDSIEELAMRPSDMDDDESYIGTVRCVGRICTESDLPEINLRERPAVAYFTSKNMLGNVDPKTNKLFTLYYDTIMASETWRITYEGTLEKDTRTDGYFASEDTFRTEIDMCALGAIPGDHLILKNRKGLTFSSAQCEAFSETASQKINLEWEITDAGVNELKLKPTGKEGDISILPKPECFTTGLEFEVRATNQWLVTSKSTYVNRRYTAGRHCVDDPRHPFGQTRFVLNSSKSPEVPDAQTAFFSVYMPKGAEKLGRGDAFEFTTRTGLASLFVSTYSAPTALLPFVTDDVHFLLISEASANTIYVYNVDETSMDSI